MTHSLNEIEALCKRAGRGSGLPWGLAEEASKSARWLSAFGLAGAGKLADLLEMNDRMPAIDVSPVSPVSLCGEVWRAPGGQMSPLIAGVSLSDCATRLGERGSITMENVGFPLLTVPFMGGAALRLGVPVAVEWDGARVATDGNALCLRASDEALNVKQADRLVFTAPAEMTERKEPVQRASVSESDWARLSAFAHRTFAPATEESRRKGAGAGATDND